MAVVKGRNVVVNVGTDGSTWNPIGELNSADMQLNGNTLDVTKFGDTFIEKVLGLRDCQWTLSGFADHTDTLGQNVVSTAFLTDGPLYIEILFDPSATSGQKGFSQQVVVSKYDRKAAANSTVDMSCTLDGTGPVTAV